MKIIDQKNSNSQQVDIVAAGSVVFYYGKYYLKGAEESQPSIRQLINLETGEIHIVSRSIHVQVVEAELHIL